MQNFVGKTKCIAGYMKVANEKVKPDFEECEKLLV